MPGNPAIRETKTAAVDLHPDDPHLFLPRRRQDITDKALWAGFGGIDRASTVSKGRDPGSGGNGGS